MLTALELNYLIKKINQIVKDKGYYLTKIYPITNDTYIFRLHRSFENDLLLVISTMGIWVTNNIIKNSIEQPYFLASLERLLRCKLLDIEQFNEDRIIRIKFLKKEKGLDVIFNLIVELFTKNIYVCDANMRIISMLRSSKVLYINSKYTPLSDDRIKPTEIKYEDLLPLISSNDPRVWLLNNVALPKKVVDIILEEVKLDKIDDESLEKLYNTIMNVVEDFRCGRRSLMVDDLDNYLTSIDTKFTSILLEKISKESSNEERVKIIKSNIETKEKEREGLICNAKKFREMAERFFNNNPLPDDLKEVEMLGIRGNVYSIASRLYNIAKRIETNVKKIDEEIKNLNKELLEYYPIVSIKVEKGKEWFEHYRWFITSDGLLVVGGKDAYSNDVLIRKYANTNDLIFHSDLYPSPFFILKDAKENSIKEVAIATAAFSKAWKEGVNAIDIYYVKREQLRATNLKGRFIINGKRNYIRNVELRLGIGVVEYTNKTFLISAPVESLKKRYLTIRPGGYDKLTIAKKIKDIVDKFEGDVELDKIINLLPDGKSMIEEDY